MFNNESCTGVYDKIKLMVKYKKIIISISVIVTFITTGISLFMPDIYQSEAVIVPVQQPAVLMGFLLAEQLNLGIPQSSKKLEIVNILESNMILEKVLEANGLLKVFYTQKELENKTENVKLWDGIRQLKQMITIENRKKDNSIKISVQYKEPAVAQQIVDCLLKETTKHITNEEKRVAESNKKHLENAIADTADPFVQRNIYSLISRQIESLVVAEAKDDFAFRIIDPPRIPDKKVKPNRFMLAISAFTLSLCLGIMIAFCCEHRKNHKKDWGEISELIGLKRIILRNNEDGAV